MAWEVVRAQGGSLPWPQPPWLFPNTSFPSWSRAWRNRGTGGATPTKRAAWSRSSSSSLPSSPGLEHHLPADQSVNCWANCSTATAAKGKPPGARPPPPRLSPPLPAPWRRSLLGKGHSCLSGAHAKSERPRCHHCSEVTGLPQWWCPSRHTRLHGPHLRTRRPPVCRTVLAPGPHCRPARPRRRRRPSDGTGAGYVYSGPRAQTPQARGPSRRLRRGLHFGPRARAPRTGAHAPCRPARGRPVPAARPTPRARTHARKHTVLTHAPRASGRRPVAMASERLPSRPACLLVASGAAEGELHGRVHSGPAPSGLHAGLGRMQRAAVGKAAPALACPGSGLGLALAQDALRAEAARLGRTTGTRTHRGSAARALGPRQAPKCPAREG